MKESTLRDFFAGAVPANQLAAEVRDAVEPLNMARRRVHIEDLPGDEQVTITTPMLVRLCDAMLTGELPGPALEVIAFTIIVSDRLHWAADDELVCRVLYDWASAEINWELTPATVRMFREWLTGEVPVPSEPEVTPDTLSGGGFLKAPVRSSEEIDAQPEG